MLGHKLWQTFARRFDAVVTFRGKPESYAGIGLFDPARAIGGLAADDADSWASRLADLRPDVVVNCIGVVKQDSAAKDPITSITVNSLFPHKIARACREIGARFIHVSTDCVFSGRRGNYSEDDVPDAEDLYGRTKLLGEVIEPGCLTIRTSMIGRELSGAHGLIEWFLSQENASVRGFRRAVFSGFTTLALAQVLADIIEQQSGLSGLYHVAAEPISKFDLLSLVRDVYGVKVEIEPDETFLCDRSLNSTRFREATGFVAPAWPEMIQAMHEDQTPYEDIRRMNA